MNANELADALESAPYYTSYEGEAATMLRQQQAEIEALKKEAALQRLFDFTQEAEIEKLQVEKIRAYDNGYEDGRKLDTNPKPAKTLTPLTEDECEEIINKHDWFSKSWREMAKEIHDAILRKANEK